MHITLHESDCSNTNMVAQEIIWIVFLNGAFFIITVEMPEESGQT